MSSPELLDLQQQQQQQQQERQRSPDTPHALPPNMSLETSPEKMTSSSGESKIDLTSESNDPSSSSSSASASASSCSSSFKVALTDQPGYLAPVVVGSGVLAESQVSKVLEELDQDYEFTASSKSKHYRNTLRAVYRSQQTADALWASVRQFFTETVGSIVISEERTGQSEPYPYCSEGTWKAVGVSPVFRCNKYGPGQHFGPHYDGYNVLQDKYRTFFTMVVYLLDVAKENGGCTNFLHHETPMASNSDGVHMAAEENILFKVQPVRGSAVIFHHRTKHEGEQLSAGSKMILNCDVMFEREPGTERHPRPSEIKAAEVLKQAQDLESTGDFLAAAKLYDSVRRIDEKYAIAMGVA